MPIEVGLWKLGARVSRVASEAMAKEAELEDALAADLAILDPSWLLIGRQVVTDTGARIDLLAMDAEGTLVVIEIKRDRTPREVVAQLLDYGSWARRVGEERLEEVYASLETKTGVPEAPRSLREALRGRFGSSAAESGLNGEHKLVLVASELDASSERIITYLSEEYGVAINAVFFRHFVDGDARYLSRAWLVDPDVVDATSTAKKARRPWNGEYYASFGVDERRNWEEARTFGFLSAGGGAWYSRTLSLLEPGVRVWVNVPGQGYVGVGEVVEGPVPLARFQVESPEGESVPLVSVARHAAGHAPFSRDAETSEYFVRMKWIATVPLEQAVWRKGFFGNQNSVARPRAQSWVDTVRALQQEWGVSD